MTKRKRISQLIMKMIAKLSHGLALVVILKRSGNVNLENQVCSLELSKRLKELGVKQESLVYWLNIQHCIHMKVKENGWELEKDENGNHIVEKIDYRIELGNPFAWNIGNEDCWSAFTVAELGEMLPISIWCIKKHKPIFLHCEPANRICHWLVRYGNEFYEEEITEANARAKMLVYLLENNLLELPNE